MVITTEQFHSPIPEHRFYTGSNPAQGMSQIPDGEDLWQWSRLEIRLNVFRRSNIPQKQLNSSVQFGEFQVELGTQTPLGDEHFDEMSESSCFTELNKNKIVSHFYSW